MSKFIDITGKRFNKLTVVSLHKKENGKVTWKCICDCGNITYVRGGNLKSGAVKSCGCINHIPKNRTHGESQTPLYRHWRAMKYRCESPNSHAYKWYGAKGVKVCDEWQTYEGFKKWVEETRPHESYTVERIDVNGDYSPQNCTWIPLSKQPNNRTMNVQITYQGKTMNLSEWCTELHLDYKLIHNRIHKLGWTFEKAVNTPVDTTKRNKR